MERIRSRTRLGFIGVGYLGSRIARRLMGAGFPIEVYDFDAAKARAFGHDGAGVAQSVQDLAGDVDVVLSCLPDSDAVKNVYFGTGKVLESARKGAGVIELSTIDPENSAQLHKAGRQHGISVLDVAISGSTPRPKPGL